MIGSTALVSMIVACVVAQSSTLDAIADRLVSPRTSPYALLEEFRKDQSEDAIIAAVVGTLRTDKRFEEPSARMRGFIMLLELGNKTADGRRQFTNHSQLEALIEELRRDEPSSIQVQIIQRLACVPRDKRERFLSVLPSKLHTADYPLVKSSLQALILFGDTQSSGAMEARGLLIDPEGFNPQLIANLQKVAPDDVSDLVAKIRIDAARARIALGRLSEDVCLYSDLNEAAKSAAASAILLQLGCDCGMLDVIGALTSDEDFVNAITFATEYFLEKEHMSEISREAIGALGRIHRLFESPLIRKMVRSTLQELSNRHTDGELRAIALKTLDQLQ